MAEKIEKSNFQNLRSSVTLTLDWVKVISACTIHIALPEYLNTRDCGVTQYGNTALRKVWSHVIAYWEGIQKSDSDKLWTTSHTIITNDQFWAPNQNGTEDRPRKVQFSELQKLSDLDLGSGWGHTGGRITLQSNRQTELDQNRKNFLWTEVWTDGWTDTSY